MKLLIATSMLLLVPLHGQAQQRLPIIDMHVHAYAADALGPPPVAMCTPPQSFPAWDPAQPYGPVFMTWLKEPPCDDPVWSPMTDQALMDETLAVMERLNIIGVVGGTAERVERWRAAAPNRVIPGLQLNVARDTAITPDSLRRLHAAGRLSILGEVTNQYAGIAPDDQRMEPYWTLAEELDLPVGIHIGGGPPGVIYLGSEGYRARLQSALTMEEVLVRHPRLRVYLMHAGYPLLDDLLALLHSHPQIYVDIGVIVFVQQPPVFYRYLQGILDAGYGNRVMFGSDQMVWPGVIERAVAVIEEAPFLSEEQKHDIIYNNAARFLRLTDEEIARHHSR